VRPHKELENPGRLLDKDLGTGNDRERRSENNKVDRDSRTAVEYKGTKKNGQHVHTCYAGVLPTNGSRATALMIFTRG